MAPYNVLFITSALWLCWLSPTPRPGCVQLLSTLRGHTNLRLPVTGESHLPLCQCDGSTDGRKTDRDSGSSDLTEHFLCWWEILQGDGRGESVTQYSECAQTVCIIILNICSSMNYKTLLCFISTNRYERGRLNFGHNCIDKKQVPAS